MRNDPFYSSKRRIKRAKKHIRDLKRNIGAFIKRKPYRLVIEPYADGIHNVHKLKAKRRSLPASFSDIAADAIENLRSSLDQATHAIAVAINTPAEELFNVAFPFSSDRVKFEERMRGCCPNFPQEITALFRSFQPHKGGNNDTLWAFNEICRTNKHRILAAMGFHIGSVHVREIRGLGNLSLPPVWDSIKNEIILGLSRPDEAVTCNLALEFFVGFHEAPVVSSKPVIAVLDEFTRVVEGIIMGVEAEARRLKLVPYR